jgi:glyoxylase-like metal-dependent hydrolase (beta-lactamase superfamily II)
LAPVLASITGLPVICLLTHAHYDHIGGAHEFSDRRAHALEAATLANPTPEATQWGGWLTADAFRRFPTPGYDFSRYAITSAPASGFLEDAAEIDFGGRTVKLMHTPGHSPGHVSVLEPSTRTLFTSDALYDGPMFFDLAGSSRADAAASVRRLIDVDAQVIHPGHFRSLKRDAFRRLGFATLARLSDADKNNQRSDGVANVPSPSWGRARERGVAG